MSLKSGKSIKEVVRIEAASDNSTILNRTIKLWDKLLQNRNVNTVLIKKVGISFYKLQTKSSQLSFNDFSRKRKNQKLSEVIDQINYKMGMNAISIGLGAKSNASEQIIVFGHVPNIKN